ncbi:tRNA processing [Polyrhizophydium stewartii]|uniref:tRNA processing n=1 Tax=Polyrhizophydium stewartii TaxID=2732419 RepID=A0ABR4N7I0_9FUNG|nr:hypothetical protein HK105_004375 [Polyrhizophydium stewartii]
MSHTLTLRIPLGSHEFAGIAARVLAVDRELKQSQVQRTVESDGDELAVTFTAASVKMLRTSVSSFLEFAGLVAQTLAEFGSVDAE